jgi:hypothetical protein
VRRGCFAGLQRGPAAFRWCIGWRLRSVEEQRETREGTGWKPVPRDTGWKPVPHSSERRRGAEILDVCACRTRIRCARAQHRQETPVSIATDEGYREVTRGEWVAILDRVVRPEIEPLPRRKYRRYSIEAPSYGEARLIFRPARNPGAKPAIRSGPLLDISPAGMMVKMYSELPIGLHVAVQVMLDGARVALRGRVVHCTNTLGGFKVGIELQF